MTKPTKLTMICCITNSIYYEYNNQLDKYCLLGPLCIAPHDLTFTKEQMELLYDIMLCEENKFKVTIERV